VRYADPMELFSFRYPLGWVYAPERSTIGAVILEHFNPDLGTLRIDVFPSRQPAFDGPDAWARDLEASLSSRLGTEISLRLLPDEEFASGNEHDQTRPETIRVVVGRGHPVDVAISTTSSRGVHERFMIDTIRLARSSFRRHRLETGENDMASRLAQLMWDNWACGWTPATRNIIGAVEAVRRNATEHVSPQPLFNMLILLDQHLNRFRPIFLDNLPEIRMLNSEIAAIRGSITHIFRRLGLPEPGLDSVPHAARAHADLVMYHFNLSVVQRMPGLANEDTTLAHLYATALKNLLIFARHEGPVLRELWTLMSDPHPPAAVHVDMPSSVLEELGFLASIAAESLYELGDRADCHETDALACATVRLLLHQSPEGMLGGTSIRWQLAYRLLTASIHKRADQDAVSIDEANRLRAEAAKFDVTGTLAKSFNREDQRRALDDVILLANNASDDSVTRSAAQATWGRLWLSLGQTEEASAALSAARQAIDEFWSRKEIGESDSLVEDVRRITDVCVALADNYRRLGRSDESLNLLERAVDTAPPVVSRSSLDVMRIASRLYQDRDARLATRWADGAAVVADGLRLATRPGEDRIRFADSAVMADVYNAAVEAHLKADETYEAMSMADRSRGRFLFEGLGGGDKSVTVLERLANAWIETEVPPPAFGPTNVRLSVEPLSEALGAPPIAIADQLSLRLESLRSALINAVTRDCALTRTPAALSPLGIAAMSLYMQNLLMIHELGDDIVLFLFASRDLRGDGDRSQLLSAGNSFPALPAIRIRHCRRQLLDAVTLIQRSMRIHATSRGRDAGADTAAHAGALKSALAEVSEILIRPIEDRLVADAGLTILPSRHLSLLPWGLLTDRHGQFLLDRYPITIAPSLSTLHALFQRGRWLATQPFRAYIAADPALSDRQRAQGFRDLPHARAEAKALLSRLRKVTTGSHVLRQGADASTLSYWQEAKGAGLVHLAAHASLSEPAELSAIHLAGGGLGAYEVADVPLSNAVVFLAACDTGQGRISADGVLGLGQSFLQAGAQAVVLTLTKVADSVTAALVDHFYAALVNPSKPLTVAEALRYSVLATRSDLDAGHIVDDGVVVPNDPVYWGTFYVLGHPDAHLDIR
jgi:CHAT domain-containing protein/tetratricopeptide (TPR) repeat protein